MVASTGLRGEHIDLLAEIKRASQCGLWHCRVAHGVSSPNYTSPNNAFTCMGLYMGPGTSEVGEHNEITMCVSANDTRSIRCAYWIGYDGDKQHMSIAPAGVDLSKTFNTFSLAWSPTNVTFLLNDRVLWQVVGKAGCYADWRTSPIEYLPWQPLSVRTILRPRKMLYVAPAHLDVAYFAYTPLGNSTGTPSLSSPPTSPLPPTGPPHGKGWKASSSVSSSGKKGVPVAATVSAVVAGLLGACMLLAWRFMSRGRLANKRKSERVVVVGPAAPSVPSRILSKREVEKLPIRARATSA